ncbi:MAG: hypothetical protein Q8P18_21280 [Pseudomonadota bacterium]|nr:hypothetical protein [Pseudomonadota bacterium]
MGLRPRATLPPAAATAEAYIPAGWVLARENEAQVTVRGIAFDGRRGAPETTGDLDGDGQADRVLVLEPATAGTGPGPDHCIACEKPHWPRAVVVIGAQDAGWRLLGVADWGDASMEARIDRGRIVATMGSYGGYSSRASELIYRLEGGRFRLIGREARSSEFCQDCEKGAHVSENWLTRTRTVRRDEAPGEAEASTFTGESWLDDGPPPPLDW